MWERLKFTERFSFVDKKKVLHIIGDDKLRDDWKYYEWTAEFDQTQAGVQRVKDWSLHTGHLDEDDLFISASVDEILSRDALHQLRWCETKNDVIFGGLWMPMGNLNNVKHKFLVCLVIH